MKKMTLAQGRQLAYNDSGEGMPVVFIHGFCEDSHIWQYLSESVAKAGHRFVCFDLPGFGGSPAVEPISIEEMAGLVILSLQELQIETCVVVGHSMGGYVSLAMLEQAPFMLAGLCLFHSHPYADAPEKKDARTKSADFILQNGSAAFVSQLIPKLFEADFSGRKPEILAQLIDRASAFPKQGIAAATIAMRDRPDRSHLLAQSPCPVQFIIGKKDNAIPWEASIEQTHLPPTAFIHILQKVSHMGMYEAKRKTKELLLEFVQYCKEVQG